MNEFKAGDKIRVRIGDAKDQKSFTTITIISVSGSKIKARVLDPFSATEYEETFDVGDIILHDPNEAKKSLKDRIYRLVGR